MALSGTGTHADPYLVSSLETIVEAFEACRNKSDAGTYYVQLVDDITGGWSNWPSTISFDTADGKFIDFDMNDHSITNYIVNNKKLFEMDGDIIRNGAIYNIYSERCTTGLYSGIKIIDQSLSAYVKNFTATLLDECSFERGGFWFKIENYNAEEPVVSFRPYQVSDENGPYQFEETDCKINVANVNTETCVLFDSVQQIVGDVSRIQGGIVGISLDEVTSYPAIASSSVAFVDSVINYDMPAYEGTVTSGTATTIVGAGTTGIINSDKIKESTYASYTMVNLIPVTDAEIMDSTALTLKGFPVYDVM